jgi:hypothetical protein
VICHESNDCINLPVSTSCYRKPNPLPFHELQSHVVLASNIPSHDPKAEVFDLIQNCALEETRINWA